MRWRSVKDGLPEDWQLVFVCYRSNHPCLSGPEYDFGLAYHNKGRFLMADGPSTAEYEHVKHWVLPELPGDLRQGTGSLSELRRKLAAMGRFVTMGLLLAFSACKKDAPAPGQHPLEQQIQGLWEVKQGEWAFHRKGQPGKLKVKHHSWISGYDFEGRQVTLIHADSTAPERVTSYVLSGKNKLVVPGGDGDTHSLKQFEVSVDGDIMRWRARHTTPRAYRVNAQWYEADSAHLDIVLRRRR